MGGLEIHRRGGVRWCSPSWSPCPTSFSLPPSSQAACLWLVNAVWRLFSHVKIPDPTISAPTSHYYFTHPHTHTPHLGTKEAHAKVTQNLLEAMKLGRSHIKLQGFVLDPLLVRIIDLSPRKGRWLTWSHSKHSSWWTLTLIQSLCMTCLHQELFQYGFMELIKAFYVTFLLTNGTICLSGSVW